MRRQMVVTAIVASAATLTGLAPAAGAGAAGAAAPGTGAAPGAQLWAARYDGRTALPDTPSSMAVSPGGGRVFVTGTSDSGRVRGDYATVAYDATTGRQLWASRYTSTGNGHGYRAGVARSVVVSPSGTKVFVTGESPGRATGVDYATVAYNAATGKQLWVTRFNGRANGYDGAFSAAVDPSGTTVFVTGQSAGARSDDYLTVAYSAATGKQLWVSRYNGPGNGLDAGYSVAVSPGGARVFVTGQSYGIGPANDANDYATVAYNATTGRQLWVSRYHGPRKRRFNTAVSVAVSSGGTRVFVTGSSVGRTSGSDYATVAYSAATGKQLWVRRYSSPGNRADTASSVAVGRAGSRVFVTGSSYSRTSGDDYATVAYSAATGKQLWVSRYNGPSNLYDEASAVVVSRAGTTVYVTGVSENPADDDYATVAYSAATGAQLWVSRYTGPANSGSACCVAVSPARGTVFVTGSAYDSTAGIGYATVAYRG